MSFRDSVVRGVHLIREAIQSPNYDPGIDGWSINKDGTAEFTNATIRGFVSSGDPLGSHIIIDPDVQVGFNDGFLQAVIRMFPEDVMMMMESMLGVVVFNPDQADSEMSTVLHSPIGTTGYAIVLVADADDGSRTAHAAIGPVTVDGDAMSFVPSLMLEEYGITGPAYLAYAETPGEIVQTFQIPGLQNWVCPPGVTSVKAECWGGGGRGGSTPGTLGGGGGGGGEYAKDSTIAVTPGTTYHPVVGAGSATSLPAGDSTFAGDAETVTAHGGASSGTQNGALGGSGSTNPTHHNGGAGGDTVFTGGGGGGGGGGTTATGGLGGPGRSTGFGGAGGTGGANNGGAGGKGGNNNGAGGTAGFAPGGGGGGAGGGSSPAPGNGASGQVRLTYTPSIVPIAVSMSAMAGVDRFGNAYPDGFAVNGNFVPDERHFQTFDVRANATVNPVTIAFQNVPGVSIPFTTLRNNAKVHVTGTLDWTVNTVGVSLGVGQILLDGIADASEIICPDGVGRGGYSQSWVITVPLAGAHTLSLQVRKTVNAGAALTQTTHSKLSGIVLDMFN